MAPLYEREIFTFSKFVPYGTAKVFVRTGTFENMFTTNSELVIEMGVKY